MLPSCLPFWSICLQDLLKHVRLNRLSRTFSSLSTIRLISIQWGCSAEHGKNIIIPLEQSIVLSPWSVSASTENTAQVSPREDHLRKGHWKSMISLRVYNTPTPLTFSLSLHLKTIYTCPEHVARVKVKVIIVVCWVESDANAELSYDREIQEKSSMS